MLLVAHAPLTLSGLDEIITAAEPLAVTRQQDHVYGWVEIRKGQAYLHGIQINEYKQANRWQHDVGRVRRLLLHRSELQGLIGAVERRGYTLIPLELYWKKGRAKLQVGLAKGKKQHDKRATDKDRDWQRDKSRIMKANRR